MAGGLAGLLDDVAALAKLAAASVDDVGAAAGRASAKAAGVVVDDTAVTPAYVRGLAADRELPIIKKIAIGSLRNKLLIILPVALVLSEIAPTLVEIILMAGGTYLCFEGAEKIYHRSSTTTTTTTSRSAMQGPEAEEKTITGAIRTDLILSAEIMVIALKEVIDEGFLSPGDHPRRRRAADHRHRVRRGGAHREDGRHRAGARGPATPRRHNASVG